MIPEESGQARAARLVTCTMLACNPPSVDGSRHTSWGIIEAKQELQAMLGRQKESVAPELVSLMLHLPHCQVEEGQRLEIKIPGARRICRFGQRLRDGCRARSAACPNLAAMTTTDAPQSLSSTTNQLFFALMPGMIR